MDRNCPPMSLNRLFMNPNCPIMPPKDIPMDRNRPLMPRTCHPMRLKLSPMPLNRCRMDFTRHTMRSTGRLLSLIWPCWEKISPHGCDEAGIIFSHGWNTDETQTGRFAHLTFRRLDNSPDSVSALKPHLMPKVSASGVQSVFHPCSIRG